MGSAAKVVVVGQGYVGLPLAMRAVEVGFDVVGLETDQARAKMLSVGDSYVEDVASARIDAALGTGRYLPTSDADEAAGFDYAVITVPTPLRDGIPDLSCIEAAGAMLAGHIRRGATVILESTTYPGTTEELLRPILEQGSGLYAPEDFHLGYSPERIDPGNATWRLENTPKVVSGLDGPSLDRVRSFYDRITAATVPVSNVRAAELTKLLENTFRHVNVALVNELAVFAGSLGVDVWEAIDAAATKPFGYLRFVPGPGVGGHCLPIDPSYLSWAVKRNNGHPFRFIELANDVNDRMPEYVVHRLTLGLNARRKPVNGCRIMLLGLAYKKNVGDVRESPALEVANRLAELGATVCAVEPYAELDRIPTCVELVELSASEVAAADAVVVLTDHDCFDYDLVASEASYLFDTRNRCAGTGAERL